MDRRPPASRRPPEHELTGFFGTDKIGWDHHPGRHRPFLTGQLHHQRYLNAAPAISN
jgi:hypothetical protein